MGNDLCIYDRDAILLTLFKYKMCSGFLAGEVQAHEVRKKKRACINQ